MAPRSVPFIKHFDTLLTLCRNGQQLKRLNSLLIVHGLGSSEHLLNQFIGQCFHLGWPKLAVSNFNLVEKSSLSLQNLVIKGLCDHKLFEDALFVYRKCHYLGCPSDNYTYPFVMKASSALNDVDFGKTVHCLLLRKGFGENLVVQTSLVDFYSKVGEMDAAHDMVDRIPQPDLVAWNALISGYSFNGFDHQVFEVFRDILFMGFKPNVSTLASLIPVCSRVGVLDIGRSIHGFTIKYGYSDDVLLIPALISMYANCGKLSAGTKIFNGSSITKNVTIWNSMISALTRNEELDEAIDLFQRMTRNNMRPNMMTLMSIILTSDKFRGVLWGESLHACVTKFGFENQIAVVTALLSMYGRLGDVKSAEFLFDNAQQRNLLLWNSMVSVYVNNCLWDAGLNAFREMQIDGFVPDAVSIVTILSLCSELKAARLGKSAHAFSLKTGINLNLNASNALLACYSDFGFITCSLNIFNRMEMKNIITWNTMISGCIANVEAETAMLLFHQMQQNNVGFDLVTLASILPSCPECEQLYLGMAIHGYAMKAALAANVSLANALVSMYVNSGEINMARVSFEDMQNKSIVSWNAVMTGYRYHDKQDEIIVLFHRMMKEGHKPNYVTLLNVLPSCCTQLQLKIIHAYAFRIGVSLETPLLTTLIMMYATFGDTKSCSALFHIGDQRDISLWNALISAYIQSKDAQVALSFFKELLSRGLGPEDVTVLAVISACLQLKDMNAMNSVMPYILHKGFYRDVAVSNALVNLHAKCGSISHARMLFEELPQKDTVSWSTMINGYGLHGDGVAALALFLQMRKLGLKPDHVTYTSILSACSHTGLVIQGKMVFNYMINDGLSPNIEQYACMVDLLSRTGHLNEAYGIIQNFPNKPSANLIESLLGACLVHGNYALGEEIGKLLLNMDLEDSGPYVILHNIHAAAGKWVEANRVRLKMEEKRLRKVPGFSIVGKTGYHHFWES